MDRKLLTSLVASASTSASPDALALARLTRRCWPGAADGTLPAAVEWVRRWGPAPLGAALPQCVCATGRCGICN